MNLKKRYSKDVINKVRELYALGVKYEIITLEYNMTQDTIRRYTADLRPHPNHKRAGLHKRELMVSE